MLDDIVYSLEDFAGEHPIITLFIIFIIIMFIYANRADRRDFEDANDYNNNILKDTKGYINRKNARKRQSNKDDTIIAVITLIIIGIIIYKLINVA
ncbi:MAG: hypothetical protein MSA89_08055 [Clostridium sp.]|nr:hypothetical protein [Clostridium sp.]MCI7443019.1 hypothetical protein [Clostridium sp.]